VVLQCPQHEIFVDCNWASGMKQITDYMSVLCKKNYIFEHMIDKMSDDGLSFTPAWLPIAPKVEVLELPLLCTLHRYGGGAKY